MLVLIWGLNFVAIYWGLKGFPPFLLCVLRFGLGAFPWVFFLPRPKAPFPYILGFGLFNFALQFGFLFTGIHLGLSPGLASLVLQVQVFFSMALAFIFLNERPGWWKIAGSLISFSGIGIVAGHAAGNSSFLALALTLLGALSWAAGNLFTKKVAADSPLALVCWGNLVAMPFMVVVSLWLEGPQLIVESIRHMTWTTVLAIGYIVYCSTLFGYGAWGFLLKHYATSAVVPFTLLVPVTGFLGSAVLLGEDLPGWKIAASLLVMSGLVWNMLEKKKAQNRNGNS